MNFIKFTHTTGTALINLSKIFRISGSSTTLSFFSDATTQTTFTFATSADADRIKNLIEKIIDSIDLNQLADQ